MSLPLSREYIRLFFSIENGEDHQLIPKAVKVARIKSILLLVALALAIIACLGWLISSVHFSNQVDAIREESTKMAQRMTSIKAELCQLKTNSSLISHDLIHSVTLKTIRALEHQPNGVFGLQVRHKASGKCLDSDHLTIYSPSMSLRLKSKLQFNIDDLSNVTQNEPFLGSCNQTATQRWHLVDGQLQVEDSRRQVGSLHQTGKPCLEYATNLNPLESLFDVNKLRIVTCGKNRDEQKFVIKVTDKQLDIGQRRVYFSLHNLYLPRWCLGVMYENYLQMEPCTGTDEQLFYLTDVDYADAFTELCLKSTM